MNKQPIIHKHYNKSAIRYDFNKEGLHYYFNSSETLWVTVNIKNKVKHGILTRFYSDTSFTTIQYNRGKMQGLAEHSNCGYKSLNFYF